MSDDRIIPSGWVVRRLRELFDFDSGQAPPHFRSGDLSGPALVYGANGVIGSCDQTNFGPGYLVGRVGAAGAITRVDTMIWASDNVLTAIPKADVCAESFGGHLLRHLDLAKLATTTAQPLVTQGNLCALPAQVPEDVNEQSLIAVVLDAVDEAIAKTEAVIAKLKQVRAGLLYDLLTRGLDEHGHVRDRINQPELFIDSPLGRIPKGWEVAPFRGYGSPDRPYIKTGPFGSSLKQEHWVERGIPVITIGSLGEGEFLRSELLYVSKGTAMELAAYAVIPGDIVFSRVADVGRSVVVGEEERGWLMSSNIMCISVDRTRADPHYVQATITSHPQVRRQIRRSLNSAGRDIANAPILNSIQVPWPRLDEQWRIVSMITSASKRIREEEKGLRKLLILKQGLTSDLLTGRVRVPEGIEVGS
jgi:type I restriction enzyme S subunit